MYEQEWALNNQQQWICYKTQPTNHQPSFLVNSLLMLDMIMRLGDDQNRCI